LHCNDNWRDQVHLAAANNETPDVVHVLLDAGAGPSARNVRRNVPSDLIPEELPLRQTESCRQLREGGLKQLGRLAQILSERIFMLERLSAEAPCRRSPACHTLPVCTADANCRCSDRLQIAKTFGS